MDLKALLEGLLWQSLVGNVIPALIAHEKATNPEDSPDEVMGNVRGSIKHLLRHRMDGAVDVLWAIGLRQAVEKAIQAAMGSASARPAVGLVASPDPLAGMRVA